jgi:hypothetical protein|nr:hypothetical protein [uncultured Sphingomonas sp.]
MFSKAVVERFKSKIGNGAADECWMWQGYRTKFGHGQFWIEGRAVVASRIALAIKLGRPLTSAEAACHSCDNPGCCNPAHLWLGDVAANNRDMIAKGRQHQQRQSACRHGHPFVPQNTYMARRADGRTFRRCRTCQRAIDAKRDYAAEAARRAAAPALQVGA